MAVRDELEQALAQRWDSDTLAVYADHLQAIGDPRGELIAIDLRLEVTGGTAALAERRASLITGWLGGLLPADTHAAWIGDSIRFGFVEDLVVESAERLVPILASPAAPYLRGVTVCGEAGELDRALGTLAEREQPWLARLAIRKRGYGDPLADELVDAIIAATPRLATLDVDGREVVRRFSHPALRRLRVTGWDALASLFEGPELDAISELDLALRGPATGDLEDYELELGGHSGELGGLLGSVRLPALERLDLTRCDRDPVIAHLAALPARDRLTHLRVRAIESIDDHRALADAIARMPALVEVEVARGSYFECPELPRVRFVHPPAWPWPRADQVDPHDGLEIGVGGYSELVLIYHAAYEMEERFEGFAPADRAAWTAIWELVRALGPTGERPLAAAVVLRALDACPELLDGGWRDLRDELRARRPFPDDALARIRRR